MNAVVESPAERASRVALEQMYACLDEGRSFRLEAGAGAGKTYSLIKALTRLVAQNQRAFQRLNQKIACITYTNVAREEILARVDRNPLIYCETNHAFCWSLISGFQRQLREQVALLPDWAKRLSEAGLEGVGERRIEYTLGHRSLKDDHLSLHHDDILPLTISLMEMPKFRLLVRQRFPVILIDEYQDTDADWIEAIKTHFLGQPNAPQFGFFGDHWQKIYGEGCGRIDHGSLQVIGKEANFRSVRVIVDSLNRMRPELPQFVNDPDAVGEVRVWHTNEWPGPRRTGTHWAGDLEPADTRAAFEAATSQLREAGWNLDAPHTKILMLTHRSLAAEQGYPSLPGVFRFNSDFIKKENAYIAYFVDSLEPACDAYGRRQFGAMFDALGGSVPHVRGAEDKTAWNEAMNALIEARQNQTVGELVRLLRTRRRPRLPDAIEDREREIDRAQGDGTELTASQQEIVALRNVAYSEIRALRRYVDGHSPFETKHGVKGAQFENVVVVIGRGWNQYNFGKMLETPVGAPQETEEYERNRNLFYVACSRPKRRLALVFTQQLSAAALHTLSHWFGADSISALPPAR